MKVEHVENFPCQDFQLKVAESLGEVQVQLVPTSNCVFILFHSSIFAACTQGPESLQLQTSSHKWSPIQILSFPMLLHFRVRIGTRVSYKEGMTAAEFAWVFFIFTFLANLRERAKKLDPN